MPVIKGTAVQAVAAGLGLSRDHPSDCISKLGVEVLGGDLGFSPAPADRIRLESPPAGELQEEWTSAVGTVSKYDTPVFSRTP
jgi:hypothetical protein